MVAVPWSPSPLLLTTRSLLAALSAPPRPQWWTKDRSDSRWNVTLRTLLSFTSGFGEQEEGSSNVTRTCMDNPFYPGGCTRVPAPSCLRPVVLLAARCC